jgi:hypothetical protein
MAATLPSRYFAPTYFSPYYFAPLLTEGGDAGAAATRFRDLDAFRAVVSALASTGEFADVVFGTTPGGRAAGADRFPVAVVMPDGWADQDRTDPIAMVRRAFFSVTLIARGEDPLGRYQQLDRLACLVRSLIDGSDLGGGCFPQLTRVAYARFDHRFKHPEQGVTLHGEFCY